MFEPLDTKEPEDLFHKAKDFFKEEKPETKKNKNSGNNFNFLLIALFVLLVCSPFIFLWFNFFCAYRDFVEIKKSVKNYDFLSTKKLSQSLSNNLGRSLKLFEITSPVFKVLKQEKKISKLSKLVSLTSILNESLYQTVNLSEEGEKVFKEIFSGEEINIQEFLSNTKLILREIYFKTSLAQGLLNEFSGNEFLVGPTILRLKSLLPESRKMIITTQEILDVAPIILGADSRKTFLILFQNNMEIRPTGGFIGSFGLATFDKGRLLDFEIRDVYFADGQLKGHVDPPVKLSELLGQAGWYLRDSNWDPDFPTSAQRAAWFLDKEIGRKVDGVIGIDLAVAQRIIGAVGEIELPDYKEKINSTNFFEKAEYYSEAGFFPGSTGKQDFLGQVGRILFEKIKEADEKTLALILQATFTSLEEKDILITVDDQQVSQFLARLNWDGALRQAQCKEEKNECLADYLMVVEANVAVNKSNYFLKKSYEQLVKIDDDGTINHQLTINYENQSPSDVFPAGKYKSYLRIYVPEGSTQSECKILVPSYDDQPETSKDCQVEQIVEHSRSVFGFLIEVPVKEKRRVEISWRTPQVFRDKEYLLLWQKQPGSSKDNLVLSIFYPKTLTLAKTEPSALTRQGIIIYNKVLSSDLVIRTNFTK